LKQPHICSHSLTDNATKNYHNLRINPPYIESHFVSFAPAVKPTFSILVIRNIFHVDIPIRVLEPPSNFGWYQYYLSPDLELDTMEPGYLTPATNPGAPKPYQTKNWFYQGGAVVDPTEGWKHYNRPQPAESLDVKPDYSNASEADEEQYHALLEFYADPEAALMRRLKEKLGHLSKKQRADIFKTYVERQRDEIERDALRELNGENARDAASMWEVDEQAEDEADAAVPDCDYGFVPAHPVLSEAECWQEYWELFYSLTIAQRNKYVEAVVWYGFELAHHAQWYATIQERVRLVERGEAPPPDPSAAQFFPPNPARAVGLGDEKPHVGIAFAVLPFGNHFMSTMHLATMVISTAKEMVKIMAKEGLEQAEMADAGVDLPADTEQILADMHESMGLMEELVGVLKAAEKLACESLSRACKAGIFDVDTDELTDYEEMSEVEEWFPPEKEEKEEDKKKGEGKKKKKNKKSKGKKKARAAETDDAAADDPSPPTTPFFDYASLLAEEVAQDQEAGSSNATAAAEHDLTVPGYTFARVSDAYATSAAGLAGLADRDATATTIRTDDSELWAGRWEEDGDDDEDEEGREYRHRGSAAVPFARDGVTGREGALSRV